METNLIIYFFIGFGAFFLVCIAIMIHVNHRLMHNADKRLARANDMVLKLSSSCDKLADVNMNLNSHIMKIDQNYESKVKELTISRDQLMHSYKELLNRYTHLEDKMLHDYERMRDASFNTIRGLAERPTIHNENKSTELSS